MSSLLLSPGSSSLAQSAAIYIDGQFSDWPDGSSAWVDAAGDGAQIDLLRMMVTNDESHLFIRLEIATDINLTDNNDLTLYLDTDLNTGTGKLINGIGADLEVHFGERDVFYQLPSGQGFMSLNDLVFRHQPTFTSTLFEMSFDLAAVSNAGFNLFNANGVRLVWKDENGPFGDAMPDGNSTFTYLFDTTPTPPFQPVDLEKSNPQAIRVLTWNTLQSGLDDLDRAPFFDKILGVLQPDIVTFNECWDINRFQVATFMNAAVPLENFQNWQTVKLDEGNVTASRFPILQSWSILPGQRLTASLIDLPDAVSATDLLIINAHFRCCSNDFERQREADAFVKFILDAKTPGGVIDLPEGTPFLLSGDLNLVGDRQQLTTLLTGEIVNNNQFGPGGPLDWDDSDLTDIISLHTDAPFAYTWRNDFSSFPPSRLDFHIVSGSASSVDKAFTLETASMSAGRLSQYGLFPSDTRKASDHLPKITDLILPPPVAVSEKAPDILLRTFPNPSSTVFSMELKTGQTGSVHISLKNSSGAVTGSWSGIYPAGFHRLQLNVSHYPSGIYLLQVATPDGIIVSQMVKN